MYYLSLKTNTVRNFKVGGNRLLPDTCQRILAKDEVGKSALFRISEVHFLFSFRIVLPQ